MLRQQSLDARNRALLDRAGVDILRQELRRRKGDQLPLGYGLTRPRQTDPRINGVSVPLS